MWWPHVHWDVDGGRSAHPVAATRGKHVLAGLAEEIEGHTVDWLSMILLKTAMPWILVWLFQIYVERKERKQVRLTGNSRIGVFWRPNVLRAVPNRRHFHTNSV